MEYANVPKFPKPRPGRHGFEFSAGRPSLDFANTVGSRFDEHREYFKRYQDAIEWARQGGLIELRTAQAMERSASSHVARAEASIRAARRLREAIFEIFLARTQGRRPREADLDELNSALSKGLAHRRLSQSRDVIAWDWDERAKTFDGILWRVALDAADLLTSALSEKVRECASDTCGWLFIDASKNRSRRWCDMASCGNREKARRHYVRSRRDLGRPLSSARIS